MATGGRALFLRIFTAARSHSIATGFPPRAAKKKFMVEKGKPSDGGSRAGSWQHEGSDMAEHLDPVSRAPLSTEATAPVFVRVPDHQLIRLIGRGSYGEVWLAKNTVGA